MTNQLLGAAFGAIATTILFMALKGLNRGQPWIITLPGTPGALADIRRRKLFQGVFTKKRGDEQEAFVTDGRVAYPTLTSGPIHLMTDYGANLIAPSKDEVAAELEEQDGEKTAIRFRVFDPLIYWRATKENDTEDYYAAQQGKPHWMEKVAPFLMIAVLGLVALVGFMLWKLMPLIQHLG
jgi:hypothetical protein